MTNNGFSSLLFQKTLPLLSHLSYPLLSTSDSIFRDDDALILVVDCVNSMNETLMNGNCVVRKTSTKNWLDAYQDCIAANPNGTVGRLALPKNQAEYDELKTIGMDVWDMDVWVAIKSDLRDTKGTYDPLEWDYYPKGPSTSAETANDGGWMPGPA